MKKQWTQQNGFWLVVGVMAGIAMSYIWPSEPTMAASTDRDNGGKFAVVTCTTQAGQSEGIFILDFLTSRLYGAALNGQTGKFTQFYRRNLAGDFNIPEGSKPSYVMCEGYVNLSMRGGGARPAQGGLYVGELNSGRMILYAFPYLNRSTGRGNYDFGIVDKFQFRESIE